MYKRRYKPLLLVCLLLVLTPLVDAKIAFYSKRDGNYEIYVMDDIPADGVYRYSPQWTRDGQRLLFGEGEDGPDRIILQNWNNKGQKSRP